MKLADLTGRLAGFCWRYRWYLAAFTWLTAGLLTAALLLGWIPLATLASWGYWGIALVNVIGGAGIVFAGPEQALTFAAGSQLSPVPLGVLAGVGNSCGELTSYFLGRSGGALIRFSRLSAKIEKLRLSRVGLLLQRYPFVVLFFFALVPNPLFDVLGMTCGALGVPLRKYFPPVLCGKVLRFLLLAFLGSRLIPR